ncbi:MAG: disulfide bond formation protein B [Octadecabacter sp.]|nr:disulfide bond formation protein B [Octadecabacter sp.]
MTKSKYITIAAFGSFALIASAFAFQFLGYAPCKMCLWQRYPHVIAIIIGMLALVLNRLQTQLAILGSSAALTTGAIGVYHTGVERDWWEGPTSCSGSGILDPNNLLSTDISSLVMCDDVVWSLMGLSMASFNALFSFALVGIWIAAARR